MRVLNHRLGVRDKGIILDCYNSHFNNPYENYATVESFYKNIFKSNLNWLKSSVIKGDLVIVNDLPIDKVLPDTPIAENFNSGDKKNYISEFSLLYLSSMLGYLKNYEDEKHGAYIHNIYPVEAKKNEASNHGYNTEFKLHSEIAFDANRPDYIILLCLRSDPKFQAQTLVVSVDDGLKELSLLEQELLTLPIFEVYPPPSFASFKPSIQPLLIMKDNKILSAGFNFNQGIVTTNNSEAKRALKHLYSILRALVVSITLKPKQALVINNKVMLHARTTFKKNGANSRWLQRVYIQED
jgi:L-asparagine oxygenase